MRARVGKVFALQPDARAATFARHPFGEIERRFAPNVMLEQVVQLFVELRVAPCLIVGKLEVFVGTDQRLRDVAPAKLAEPRRQWLQFCNRHQRTPFTARMNARTFSISFEPFVSTPLETSTAHGRTCSTAAATFSGVRPPAIINGNR